MRKNRDRTQLKFRLILHIGDAPIGISKYKLKKLSGISTSKQIDSILSELIEGSYITVESRGDANYYRLSEKGIEFLENASKYFLEFLGIQEY